MGFFTENNGMTKFRISISDGGHRFSQAVMMLENERELPNDLDVIKLVPKLEKNSLKIISGKLILVIGSFKVRSSHF